MINLLEGVSVKQATRRRCRSQVYDPWTYVCSIVPREPSNDIVYPYEPLHLRLPKGRNLLGTLTACAQKLCIASSVGCNFLIV